MRRPYPSAPSAWEGSASRGSEARERGAFRPAPRDLKFALRLECADAGLLTQFLVTPSTDRHITNAGSLEHRAHSAWLDGLRQLGVRVLPQHTLGDITVLGCHANDDRADTVPGKPDDAEALALAMHQLRQAPDYAAALSLPLPLHLAELAQAYVLPMLAEGDGSLGEEAAEPTTEQSPEDPDLVDAADLATEPEVGESE